MTSEEVIAITDLLALPDNYFCADCKCNRPDWGSCNLGVFLCIACSGIHRSLGAHVSFVRSCKLDSWTYDQIELMRRVGNAVGNKYWEETLPIDYERPNTMDGSTMAQFIHNKYILRQWVGKRSRDPSRRRSKKRSVRATREERKDEDNFDEILRRMEEQREQIANGKKSDDNLGLRLALALDEKDLDFEDVLDQIDNVRSAQKKTEIGNEGCCIGLQDNDGALRTFIKETEGESQVVDHEDKMNVDVVGANDEVLRALIKETEGESQVVDHENRMNVDVVGANNGALRAFIEEIDEDRVDYLEDERNSSIVGANDGELSRFVDNAETTEVADIPACCCVKDMELADPGTISDFITGTERPTPERRIESRVHVLDGESFGYQPPERRGRIQAIASGVTVFFKSIFRGDRSSETAHTTGQPPDGDCLTPEERFSEFRAEVAMNTAVEQTALASFFVDKP